MKNSILKLTSILLTTSILFVGCSSSDGKVEEAKENMTEAQKDLDKANLEYLAEVGAYRTETNDKINANNQSIIDFNERIENQKNDVKAEYRKKVADLEEKNSDMKKRMEDYKADGKENWESFKREFSHDMDELGQAFKDLTINNKK